MKFAGKYLISAPRERVWQALNDTELLKRTLPGMSRIDWVADDRLEAEMAVGLKVTELKLRGEITLANVVPAESYTLHGKAKGGLLGWARGDADVNLADDPGGTILEFQAAGKVGAGLAGIGNAVLGKSAQGIIDRFFARFAEEMDATSEPLPNG